MDKHYYIYMLTNRPNGILYIGVTNDLIRRIYEHKNKLVKGFTEKYGLNMLVYFEMYADANTAIYREKCMKNWKRAWKIKHILQTNPTWRDLYTDITSHASEESRGCQPALA